MVNKTLRILHNLAALGELRLGFLPGDTQGHLSVSTVIGKVLVEDWVFLFTGKDSECPKNLLALHIRKQYSFDCETIQLQEVSSGLNRIFV